MTKLVRVPLSALAAGRRNLDSKTAHYLHDVLRVRAGEAFIAFDPDARLEADATLGERNAQGVECQLASPRAAARVVSSAISLVQALGKGDKTEQVVRSATALGAAEIHLVESARSVARAGERSAQKRERLAAIALDAARQSGRGDVPAIAGPQALEHELAVWRDVHALKLCLVPGATHSFRSLTQTWIWGSPIAILVGPEGGFTSDEIAAAFEAGFVAARFGELVLRTEIAGIAVLGALGLLGSD